jgi:hypothetical protein
MALRWWENGRKRCYINGLPYLGVIYSETISILVLPQAKVELAQAEKQSNSDQLEVP